MAIEYIVFALALFLAGIVPELTGFGVATISMPLLAFVLPLPVAIPLVAVISALATGIVALQTKTRDTTKYILPLLIGSAAGIFLGMVFLNTIEEGVLKLTFSIFLIVYALYSLIFKGHLLPIGKLTGTIIGIVAGFFGAAFNIHGPLVGVYSSSNKNLSKKEIKDLIATYMFATGIMTIAGHTISGRMTGEVMFYLALALPFLFVGLFVGKRVFRKISAKWVRRGVYVFCSGSRCSASFLRK